jgi:hypothetical protein
MSLFKELYHKNVNDHTQKVQGLTYLSWSYAWAEIKKIDEKASVKIHEFPMFMPDGMPIEGVTVPYLKTPEGYFVKVSVTINGHTETEMLPVMDNKNVPLGTIAPVWVKKDGASKSVKEFGPTPQPTSFDINTAHKRCMVKAIALHGLGLYIYNGEDLPETDPEAAKKEEENRLALVKKIRDKQKATLKAKSQSFSLAFNDYVVSLEQQAKMKVEKMPLTFLEKMEKLIDQKYDELDLAEKKPKESAK